MAHRRHVRGQDPEGLDSTRFDYAAALAPEKLNGNYPKSKQDFRSGFAKVTFETEHPVVRVHPETGERSLLLGHFVREFVGLKAGSCGGQPCGRCARGCARTPSRVRNGDASNCSVIDEAARLPGFASV